jgi:hypothetical protein
MLTATGKAELKLTLQVLVDDIEDVQSLIARYGLDHLVDEAAPIHDAIKRLEATILELPLAVPQPS